MKFFIQIITIIVLTAIASIAINGFIMPDGDNVFVKYGTIFITATSGFWLGGKLYDQYFVKDDPQPPT